MDREQLETFATVAELQSFDKAARALYVTRGAVSQRLKALEQALATVLLVRDKPVAPTPAGEILLRHVQALRLLEAATLRELAPAARPGEPVRLAVAVNADSLATWFGELVWPLLEEQAIALEVVVDDLDHTAARLARGQVVGCVSSDAEAASGFVAEPLAAMAYRCYASPRFVAARLPDGLTLAAARTAPAVIFDRKDSLHERYLARRFGRTSDRVPEFPRHFFPSPPTLLEAIERGAGYGLLPSWQAEAALARGTIVELAPFEPLDVPLFWHRWSFEPAPCRELTRRVLAGAGRPES